MLRTFTILAAMTIAVLDTLSGSRRDARAGPAGKYIPLLDLKSYCDHEETNELRVARLRTQAREVVGLKGDV